MSALDLTDPDSDSSGKRKSKAGPQQAEIASHSGSQGSQVRLNLLLRPARSIMPYFKSPSSSTMKPIAHQSGSHRTARKTMTYGKKGRPDNDNRRASDLFGSVIAQKRKRQDRRQRRVRFSVPLFTHIPDAQMDETTSDSMAPVTLPQQAAYVL